MSQPTFIAFAITFALLGCDGTPRESSPFSGVGESGIDGVLALVHVGAGKLPELLLDEESRHLLPSNLKATAALLDPEIYQASVAYVFAGARPELIIAALELADLIEAEGDGGTYLVRFEGLLPDLDVVENIARVAKRGNGLLQTQRGGRQDESGLRLKRFDSDDRVLLASTGDLEVRLVPLSRAAEAELPRSVQIALAVDGPQVARSLRRYLGPKSGELDALLSMTKSMMPEEAGFRVSIVEAAMQGLLEVVETLRGGVMVQTASDFQFEVTHREEGLAADLMACLLPIDGDYPQGAAMATSEITIALDVDRLRRLVFARLERVALKGSRETSFVEQIEPWSRISEQLDGRVWCVFGERTMIGLGLKESIDDVSRAELRRLVGPLREENGWLLSEGSVVDFVTHPATTEVFRVRPNDATPWVIERDGNVLRGGNAQE